jgi:hypothetical protein
VQDTCTELRELDDTRSEGWVFARIVWAWVQPIDDGMLTRL